MSEEQESDGDIEEGDDDYDNYYSAIDDEVEFSDAHNDPESFPYECLRVEEVEKLLNELVEHLSLQIHVRS